MSTILKALRRLEQDKAAGVEGRPLREEVAVGGHIEASGRRLPRWAPAAAALLVGLAVGAGVFGWMRSGADPETTTVASAVPAREAPRVAARERATPEPARAPVRLASPPETVPEDAFASPVEVVARPPALPRLEDPSPVAPDVAPKPGQRRPVEDSSAARRMRRALADAAAAGRLTPPPVQPAPDAAAVAKAAPPAPAPRAEAQAAPPAPIERAKTARDEQPKPAPAPAAKPKPTPAAKLKPEPTPVAVAKPAPAPKPTPAPAEKPAPLPSIEVEKTLWHPLPERRRAWLRLEGDDAARTVVEGDVIAGMLVAEIEPSGIVLERDGERIERGLGKRR